MQNQKVNKHLLFTFIILSFLFVPKVFSCSLNFTSPQSGTAYSSPIITVTGTGEGDADSGDNGQVTARINGRVFFSRSGSFTALVDFFRSGSASVRLEKGINQLSLSGSVGGCSASDSIIVYYNPELTKLEKSAGNPNACAGNPISIATGNKFQSEMIYGEARNPYFNIHVFYNNFLGTWQQPYSQSIRVLPIDTSLIKVQRPDGKVFVFTNTNGVWESDADVTAQLLSIVLPNSSNGWKLTLQNNDIETYDSLGRLHSISRLGNELINLSYDDAAHTTLVTDSISAINMTLKYDTTNTDRLTKVTDANNGVYRFGYADNGLLKYVSYPDETSSPHVAPTSHLTIVTPFIAVPCKFFLSRWVDLKFQKLLVELSTPNWLFFEQLVVGSQTLPSNLNARVVNSEFYQDAGLSRFEESAGIKNVSDAF